MMRRQPQDNGTSALTTHQLQVERRERESQSSGWGLLGGHDRQGPVEGNWPGHRGYTPTLYEKCHGIFNDHRESGPRFNVSSERRCFLPMEARFPIWPRDRPEVQDRVLREREKYVKERKKKDRERDLTLTDIESAKWSFTLWHEPLLRCFPEVDIKQGSRGKIAWIYVKIDDCWQVRSWSNLAIELAQGGEWVETPKYDKDYRGTQPRSNVTKERRASTRKMKTVQLTVAPPNDLNKHKVWCSATNAFVNGAYYDNEQITEELTEVFNVIMHYKINILACAHPTSIGSGGLKQNCMRNNPMCMWCVEVS